MISNMYFKGLITLRTGRNVGKFIVQYMLYIIVQYMLKFKIGNKLDSLVEENRLREA